MLALRDFMARNIFVLVVLIYWFPDFGLSQNAKYECEGRNLSISCPNNDVIKIVSFNYGRLTSEICPTIWNNSQQCRSASSEGIVSSKCNGLTQCDFLVANSVFGDPCHGTVKYGEVQYVCVRPRGVCPDYYYGSNCTNKCGHCLTNGTCNTTTGECHRGCDPGWTSVFCNQTCPAGNYGQNCSNKCGFCESTNASCDPVIGICPFGCQVGYQPPLCDKSCINNTYGKNCSQTCGHCMSSACDTITGHCGHCQGNFALPLCYECQKGRFGESCSQTCMNCDGDQSCQRNTGLCALGCLDGFESPNCTTKCKAGNYGKHCQEICGNCKNSACRYDNGFCEYGCVDPYNGNICKATNDVVPIIVGVVVPLVVILTVGALLILWWLRRRRKQKNNSGHCPQVKMQDIMQDSNEPSGNQMVIKDTDDVGKTHHIYEKLQTGTPDVPVYSVPTFKENDGETKEDLFYYNT